MSPVLQHLGMGLGLGALGFLLVIGVRGGDERLRESPTPTAVTAAPEDAAPPARIDASAAPAPSPDAAPPDAAVAAPPPPHTFRVADLSTDATVKVVDGTLGHRPFLTALAASGVLRGESYRLVRAVGQVHDLNHTSPGDAFHVASEKATGRVVAFEYVTSPLDVFQAREEGGELVARRLELRFETRRVAAAVAVGKDLRAAVVKAGLLEEVLPKIDEALDGHAELSDLHPGTRLRVLATEVRLEGAFLRYAPIDAIELSVSPGAPPLRVYLLPSQVADRDRAPSLAATHAGSYYDAKGQQPYHGGWRIPVPSARIASRFNPRRMHPTLHVVMPHNGVDFAAPTGTPIYAAASGTVRSVGDSGPCGNMVQVEHAAGIVSSYCHMSRFAPGVRAGGHVDGRQLLGYVGQTGRATGPHLHFAIKRNGVFIDPLALKLDGVRVIPPSRRDEFDALRAGLDRELDGIRLEPGAGPETEPLALDGGSDGGPAAEDLILDEAPLP